MAESVETVTAFDQDSRTYVTVQVIVKRSWILRVSCNCYRPKHAVPSDVECIETDHAVYFREVGSEANFREIGHGGPVSIELTDYSNKERYRNHGNQER